jgi:hypothetical protein
MTANLNASTLRAIEVTGRFGFLSRENFWRHITKRQKSENYVSWKRLTQSGLFKAYRGSDQHLYLSRSGIQVLQERDASYVGKAHPMYFEHDEILMSVALACENAGLIKPTWACDAVIRKLSNVDKVRLLAAHGEKIPDLVFDLNVDGDRARVALEVERTRKSAARYDSLVLSYLTMRAVDLVLIAYNDAYTEKQIRHSIKRLGYPQGNRPMAFCKIKDLIDNPSSFPMQLGGNLIGFDRFVSNLRSLEAHENPRATEHGPEKFQESIPENHPVKRSA